MTIEQLETASQFTIGGVSILTIGTFLVRALLKMYQGDKLQNRHYESAEVAFARLNKDIERFSSRCEKLETKLDKIRNVELEGASDLASLVMYLKEIPCGKCGNPHDKFDAINDIVSRMIIRRQTKFDIMLH